MSVTIPQLAERYAVTPRTIIRWKKCGIDVQDVVAVADHVATNPRPRLRTLEAVAALIESPTTNETPDLV